MGHINIWKAGITELASNIEGKVIETEGGDASIR